jgi:F-type H+-transporting ATPase subunit b
MGIVETLTNDPTLWVAISTVLCISFIAWKAYKPILGALDSRANMISVRLREAEELHEEAKLVLAQYKQKSNDAASEAEQVLRNAQVRADKLRTEMEAELAQMIARQEASVKLRIARLEAEAIETVKQAIIQAALDKAKQEIGQGKAGNDNIHTSLDRITKIMSAS